jgi:hypothetical protein
MDKNRKYALPDFGVITLFHFELCLEHNSETARDINKKQPSRER